jgi:hypothetical protein
MIHRISHVAALVTLVGSLLTIPAANALAQNQNRNRLDIPITGVVQTVGTFTGTFALSRFAIQDGALMAIGQLSGTITNTATGAASNVVSNIALPVSSITGSCDILHLVLGPLHLDLLGLVVDLNQVVLDITATTGSGDLLGNLLCAITGLLDAGALGQTLVNLLNQLIGVLAGL